jgi:UDPglucose--hexose-1-phosphate uridylyltransferase
MSELRLNRATKEWIIIAKERAKRPKEFKSPQKRKQKEPLFDPKCPFCPGNEKQTPPEVFALRSKNSKPNSFGWEIRVIPNKFPALTPQGEVKISSGFFKMTPGVGKHEVIIEAKEHNQTLATLALGRVEKVCLIYRQRYLELAKNKEHKLIIIFKNHGESAGTSLLHPHSQLIALPVVPTQIRHLLEEATRYFDDQGACVFCDMIEEELKAKKRIIFDDKDFVALHPFASRTPFETWILPKKHQATFGGASVAETKRLAFVLKDVLEKLYTKLNNPDYNLVIRTAPIKDANEDYYHWYVQILPRLTNPAGFELGSGVYINTSIPEETAKFLRE